MTPLFQFLWALILLEDKQGRLGFYETTSQPFLQIPLDITLLISAIFVLCFPRSFRAFLFLIAVAVINTISAMPNVANDSFVILSVNFILLCLFWKRARTKSSEENYLNELRPLLLPVIAAVYFLAVFHKLNSGFFHPEFSCVQEFTSRVRKVLPFWPPVSKDWTALFAGLTLIVESSIGLFMMSRQLRVWGLLLGFLFHLILGLTVDTFSSVMFALFLLFIPLETDKVWVFFKPDQQKIFFRILRFSSVALVMAMLWFGRHGTGFQEFVFTRRLWLVLVLIAVLPLAAHIWKDKMGRLNFHQKPRVTWWSGIVLSFFLVNGFGPYLGFRTTLTFSMFSNLHVEQESNHLLVPKGSLQIFDLVDDLVSIGPNNSPLFKNFIGFKMPLQEVRRRLRLDFAHYPQSSLKVFYQGKVYELKPNNLDPLFAESVPEWKNKLLSFRPVAPAEFPFCLW